MEAPEPGASSLPAPAPILALSVFISRRNATKRHSVWHDLCPCESDSGNKTISPRTTYVCRNRCFASCVETSACTPGVFGYELLEHPLRLRSPTG